MSTIRLTAAQALVRYLSAQVNEDGERTNGIVESNPVGVVGSQPRRCRESQPRSP